jgi:hypothetical protein
MIASKEPHVVWRVVYKPSKSLTDTQEYWKKQFSHVLWKLKHFNHSECGVCIRYFCEDSYLNHEEFLGCFMHHGKYLPILKYWRKNCVPKNSREYEFFQKYFFQQRFTRRINGKAVDYHSCRRYRSKPECNHEGHVYTLEHIGQFRK